MKLRNLALIISLISVSLPAAAAPVFMLQFGSFETRAEADERLATIKTKHAGVVGALPSSIREITLPPDNLTVYRTQAGPVESRTAAQSICSQLASNGDECYVVETAMLPPAPNAPKLAAAAPAPAPASAAAPPSLMPALASGTLPQTQVIPTITPSPAPTPALTEPVPPQPIPPRDPRNMAALAGINATPAAPALPVPPAPSSGPALAPLSDMSPAKPSPELQAAMDRAVAVQNAELAAPKPVPPAYTPPPKTSFWSRVNPFNDNSATAPKPVPPAPVAAPVEAVAVALPAAAPQPLIPPADMPAPASIPSPVTAPALQTAPPAPQPMVAMDAPQVITQAEPLRLPPPPAPLRGQAQPPAPMPTGVIAAPSQAAPFAAPAPQFSDNRGTGRVEEAQRVPLSGAMVPPPPAVAAVPGPAPMAQPAVPMSPSATLGQKTLWAQMGSFPNTASALAFWDQYRMAHPDFPMVRVRVISPYMATQRGNEQVFLRVGPFARDGFIANLCSTLPQENFRCGQITDMGIASGERRPGFLPGSRYQR